MVKNIDCCLLAPACLSELGYSRRNLPRACVPQEPHQSGAAAASLILGNPGTTPALNCTVHLSLESSVPFHELPNWTVASLHLLLLNSLIIYYFLKCLFVFIYLFLAAPGLGCGTRNPALQCACLVALRHEVFVP